MPDVFGPEKRSQVMSNIRGVGNHSTELRLISVMKEYGIKGWRRRRPVFGNPDFVFYDAKIAVFVGGCFWHGCPEHYRSPQTNAKYWQQKYTKNTRRDEKVSHHLAALGWRVVRIWEHELKRTTQDKVAERLAPLLTTKPLNVDSEYLRVAEPTTTYEMDS
jgi:DNA mismatch endonuclease (patch repair protein)